MNPVIILAIIVQGFVSRASKTAGAVMGFVVTTGILIWGISVYGDHSEMAFFGAAVPEPIFIVLCLVWYGFDTNELIKARRESEQEAENLSAMTDPSVREAWSATWRAWRAGLGLPAQTREAAATTEKAFVDGYIRKTGRLMQAVTSQRPFEPDEFIVYATVKPGHAPSVLTDRTLYLLTPDNVRSRSATVIPLNEIESYKFDTAGSGRLVVKLWSGPVIDEQRAVAPKEEFLNQFRAARMLP